MKKFCVLFLSICLIFVSGCKNENGVDTKNKDAINFKTEYEKSNGVQKENSDKTIRTLTIPEDNPFIYKEPKDIVDSINNKETFLVYFGFADCPWCRSVVPTLIEIAKERNIKKIYYVDIKEIRDILTIDKSGNIKIEKEGTEDYYQLLKLLDKVLTDYKLKDNNDKTILTGSKRIYAPNIVAVIKGEAKKMVTGISEKQTDGYAELTDAIKDDIYNQFKSVIDLIIKK